MVTNGYERLRTVTNGYEWLRTVTNGNQRKGTEINFRVLYRVISRTRFSQDFRKFANTNGYEWLRTVTNGYEWLRTVTNCYKRSATCITPL